MARLNSKVEVIIELSNGFVVQFVDYPKNVDGLLKEACKQIKTMGSLIIVKEDGSKVLFPVSQLVRISYSKVMKNDNNTSFGG